MEELARLQEITRTLREPGGCDWDRAQDFRSMRPHLVEEAYEVIDAVDRNDREDLKDELGDLLFLVHFFARLGEEEGSFGIADVARAANEKLVRRHPHVFADTRVAGVGDILRNWESIKQSERAAKSSRRTADEATGAASADSAPAEGTGPELVSVLSKREESLPALFRATKIQEKVSRVGFDWQEPRAVLDKVTEEAAELVEVFSGDHTPAAAPAERAQRIEHELGDLLFSLVNLARHLGANPELALQAAVDRFIARFREVERRLAQSGKTVAETEAADLDRHWEAVKASEPVPEGS